MRRAFKLCLAIAIMAASGYVLYRANEHTRLTERLWHPDPDASRATAWAELKARGLEPGSPVFIRVFKQSAELEVWLEGRRGWELFRTIPVCNYSGRLGPKLKEGDRQAPEGFYTVTRAQMNPNSRHHLSFNLGFPNRYDRSHGRTGSFLMVHGGCSSIGCYAIRDHEVEVVYRLMEAAFDNGQREVAVHAFPFRLDSAALEQRKGQKWYGFWAMLKPGYDRFEQQRRLPQVMVANRSYVVN